jgi:hypothetical protein
MDVAGFTKYRFGVDHWCAATQIRTNSGRDLGVDLAVAVLSG